MPVENTEFERYIVAGVETTTGNTIVATEDEYVPLEAANLLLVALSKRDAGAAHADMTGDDEIVNVTVHRLVIGPALAPKDLNTLFEA